MIVPMTLRTTQRIALLCMLGLSFLLHGAEKPSPGRTIYVRQCAKCHGRNGEGVKGKYEDALHGHWSVEKLTRYISKNMPEDDPGSCTGPQAEEVARYVHDTLYTKHTPPRVELARLTNRQYVNTVADLVRNFTGTDQPPGPDRGLHANYYNSQGFNDAKKVITRIDPQIDFNYGTNTPDARKLTRTSSQ